MLEAVGIASIAGLYFEQMPRLDAGRGCWLGPIPHWPQVSEIHVRAGTLPPLLETDDLPAPSGPSSVDLPHPLSPS